MPNWCTNTTVIRGEKTEVDRFLADIGYEEDYRAGDINICRTLLPLSDRAIVQGEHGGYFAKATDDYMGGWNEAHAKWGTKWGDCDTQVFVETDERIVLKYDTAWGPMENALLALSEKYDLQFTTAFHEQGMGFAALVRHERGTKTIDEDHSHHFNRNIDWEADDADDQYDEWYIGMVEDLDDLVRA